MRQSTRHSRISSPTKSKTDHLGGSEPLDIDGALRGVTQQLPHVRHGGFTTGAFCPLMLTY